MWVCSQVLNNLSQKRICGYASSHVFTTGNAQLSFFISRNQWSSNAHPRRSDSCIQGCIVAQYFIRKETGNVVVCQTEEEKKEKKTTIFLTLYTGVNMNKLPPIKEFALLPHLTALPHCLTVAMPTATGGDM